jgi:putative membrane protein
MHHGNWHDGGGGNWWWIPMAIMMIAFWAGLIWLAISVVRHNTHHATGAPITPTAHQPAAQLVDPRQVLAERLARGEIDVDDYRARLDALDTTRPRT